MPRKEIECEECGFFGYISYKEEDCTFINITFCPVCGFDLTDDEKISKDFYSEFE